MYIDDSQVIDYEIRYDNIIVKTFQIVDFKIYYLIVPTTLIVIVHSKMICLIMSDSIVLRSFFLFVCVFVFKVFGFSLLTGMDLSSDINYMIRGRNVDTQFTI